MSNQDKKHRQIKKSPHAFARHDIVTGEEGNPVDYIFLEVNAAFEEMSGLSKGKILGEKVSTILPCFKNGSLDWPNVYSKIILAKDSVTYEEYSEPSEPSGCCYEITAYSGDPAYITLVIRDVTVKTKNEEALRDSEQRATKQRAAIAELVLDESIVKEIGICFSVGDILLHYEAAGQANRTLNK